MKTSIFKKILVITLALKTVVQEDDVTEVELKYKELD